ncbi:MAG: MBL fold metallo-hydrolase [Candidatus Ornithomonoglobus sp.]
MIELHSIISGSSGNCSLVTDGETNILVDCGASGKRILNALHDLDVEPEDISAIVVTHEHIDHTRGVGVLARKLKVPVFATAGTHSAMEIGRLADEQCNIIAADNQYSLGDIGFTPFSIPHDAAEPCGYTFTDGETQVAVATDMGCMTKELFSHISGSKSIILESNHDIEMLKVGPYPYNLKRRILSNIGHLSNRIASLTALRLIQTGTEHIMLGHLSEHNNMPGLALLETTNHLKKHDVEIGSDVTIQVADRYEITSFSKGGTGKCMYQ